MLYLIWTLLFCTALANSFSLWNQQSDPKVYSSAPLSHTIRSLSASTVSHKCSLCPSYSKIDSDCDSVVVSWLQNNQINYNIRYCLYRFPKWVQGTGWTPHSHAKEGSFSRSYTVPLFSASGLSQYLQTHSPPLESISVAPVNDKLVFAITNCRNLQRTYTHSCSYCNSWNATNPNHCIDWRTHTHGHTFDVAAGCSFVIHHNHSFRSPSENNLVTTPVHTQLWHMTNTMHYSNSYVNHTIAAVSAMTDLNYDGVPDLVYGALIQGPTGTWYPQHFSPSTPCSRSWTGATIDSTSSPRQCLIRVFVARLNADFSVHSQSSAINLPFPCFPAEKPYVTCSAQFLRLGISSNARPDLFISCSDHSDNQISRIYRSWTLTGYSGSSVFNISPFSAGVSDSHLRIVPLELNNFQPNGDFPAIRTGSYNTRPLMVLTHTFSQGLRYVYMWKSSL
ncbi:hypothetical protein RCL1_003717 [Eukaryota sp. TZLM3-RCL]